MHIIDRRLNPGRKGIGNRQRFLQRGKELVARAVRDSLKTRSITDVDQGAEVNIAVGGLREPRFRLGPEGRREFVLPGNKRFVEGDTIPRPPGGGGAGSNGGSDGSGDDDFRFVLTHDEYLGLFLDDLQLPDLRSRSMASTEIEGLHRAGYSVAGSPSNLAIARTLRNSLSRRIALHRPKPEKVAELQARIDELEQSGGDEVLLDRLRQELKLERTRVSRIPYIDPIDLRYRQFAPHRKSMAQAVMFCLMDVSGSMTEELKDLSKRFFALLHIFLARRYHHVEIVFIRHTHVASEVDEETFFHSTETGGTVVSSALELMARIIAERYRPEDWNIYGAQASDGDNEYHDRTKTAALLKDHVLPWSQYYAYIEVGRHAQDDSVLWSTYAEACGAADALAMRKVSSRDDIYPVFRDLFRPKNEMADH